MVNCQSLGDIQARDLRSERVKKGCSLTRTEIVPERFLPFDGSVFLVISATKGVRVRNRLVFAARTKKPRYPKRCPKAGASGYALRAPLVCGDSASVDGDLSSGHVGCSIRDYEPDDVRHFFRCPRPIHRDAAEGLYE